MVTCSRSQAKSTLGRAARCVGLTGGGVGATVALAVVTTSGAGMSRWWPTAVSLLASVAASWAGARSEGALLAEAAAPVLTVGGGTVAAAGPWAAAAVGAAALGVSQAKWFSSKGRLV